MQTNTIPAAWQQDQRYTGSTEQLYSVRRLQLRDGPGAGQNLIEVKTAAGLQALFSESHALDLLELSFRGINIGFISKNGLQRRMLPVAGDFHRSWSGGLLATCGLRNTGPDCRTEGEYHPQHGLILSTAAEQVQTGLDMQSRQLSVSGVMRETALFGHNLLLQRKITLSLDEATLTWEDQLINLAAEPQPVLILYHFNFGYPFLSPDLKLSFPAGEVIPRNDDAAQGLEQHAEISEPIDGESEQVFFHYPMPEAVGPDGQAAVRLQNSKLNIEAVLRYNPEQLPVLTQWKSMKSGDYALGIEPGNSLLRGREEEARAGFRHIIPGYSCWPVRLSLAFA